MKVKAVRMVPQTDPLQRLGYRTEYYIRCVNTRMFTTGITQNESPSYTQVICKVDATREMSIPVLIVSLVFFVQQWASPPSPSLFFNSLVRLVMSTKLARRNSTTVAIQTPPAPTLRQCSKLRRRQQRVSNLAAL